MSACITRRIPTPEASISGVVPAWVRAHRAVAARAPDQGEGDLLLPGGDGLVHLRPHELCVVLRLHLP